MNVFGDKASILTCLSNPENKNIHIGYRVGVSGMVNLSVVSPSGRTVRCLSNSFQKAGSYSMEWNAKAKSGVYFVVLKTDNGSVVRKALMVQ
jgi:hypothetical protein